MASGWVEGPEDWKESRNSVRVDLRPGPRVMMVRSVIRRALSVWADGE